MHAEDEGVSLLRTTTIGEGSSGEGRRLMKMNIDSPAASPIDVSEIPQPMMATTPISADPIPSPPPAGFRVGVAGVDPHEYKVDWSKPMKSWMCTCLPYFLQLIMLACLGSFLFGFNLSLLNTSINHIAWEFRWCKYYTGDPIATCDEATIYKAFLSTSIFIGAAIGSLTGGVFLGFGRRGMMQISNVIFLLGIIGSCCAHSFSALLWARLCVGYGVGLISFIIPAYLSEITPSVKRGFYGVFHQLFVTIGILAGTVVGLPLPFKDPIPEPSIAAPDISAFSKVWWRVMLGLAFIPVLLSLYLLGTVYTFETPHYYLEKGHIADAKALYERLLDSDDVDSALEEANHEVEEGRKARLAGVSLSAALKHKEYRHVIIVGCLLAAFQQLSGVNVFMAQSNKLFIDAGLTGYMPTVMTVVMCLINCIMTLPAVPLIESLGRRTLLLAGCIGMALSVLPATIMLWIHETSTVTMWLCIAGSLIFIINYAVSYGPILWVYLFEIYPLEIRGVAAGLATACNWIAGIIMVFVTNYLNTKTSYLVFEVMTVTACIIIGTAMLETKGRTLGDSPYCHKRHDDEIQELTNP